jgi:uncharacterized membrane protein
MQPCLPIYFLILLFTLASIGFYIAVLRHLNTMIEMDRKVQEAQRKIDEQIKSGSR